MKKTYYLAGLALVSFPLLALAWWNDDWNSRRQISVDAAATGADIHETLTDVPVLIRLHAGNFGYFADLADKGRDIRFLKDDKTPLRYQVEQLDPLSEIGLIWVRLPQLRGGVDADSFWMYYGNGNSADGSDGKNLYDPAQSLVYHFQDGETLPHDATAYLSHAADSKAQILSAGWIGAAAQFNASGPITVNPVPQLAIAPDKGWTFSSWIKIDQPQTNAKVIDAQEGTSDISLGIQGTVLSVHWQRGVAIVDVPPVNLTLSRWQYLTLLVKADKLELYVDGVIAGSAAIQLQTINPTIQIGNQLVGLLDEVQISATSRSPDWIKFSYRSQSPDFSVLNFGQDESNSSGNEGHFMVIVQNVTLDGWVIIGLTGIMLIMAILVIVSKTLVINRISKDNSLFLDQYRRLDPSQLAALIREETDDEKDLADSELLKAVIGKHDHFQSSPLYHLYHLAINELQKLQGDVQLAISPQAWNYLHVKLDSRIVIENQQLNKNMVLLTIAIAGGPFLGLLGTVVGVMITFAAIAASGDVNINSIAPGIAAALLATVAGLAVAIPSLFAYNYLLIQIKEITASMRIFSDELLALLSMRAAQLPIRK